MSASPYASVASNIHEHDDNDSILMPTIAKRRVQIPQIQHSTTMSSDTLVQQQHQRAHSGSTSSNNRLNPIMHSSFETGSTTELPPAYEIPSADNGGAMELRQSASMPLRTSESNEGRKSSGIRAALANKFSAKKKDVQSSPSHSLSSKRQQLQLESLLMQSSTDDLAGSDGRPTVRGQAVGHPMAFHHVEHLSPTVIGPKMSLINSPDLYRSYTQPAKSTAPQQLSSDRKSPFRSLNPVSLLAKSASKALPPAPSGASDPMKTVVTVRGKPIGAPTEFQHVEHLSASDIMKNYQLLNQRQQQAEIMSVLSQPSNAVGSERSKKSQTMADRTPKTTYRGLPLSGPVTFEHVEHISVKDYKMHVANSHTLEPNGTTGMSTVNSNASSTEATAVDSFSEGEQQGTQAHQNTQPKQQSGPRLTALQHTSSQQQQQSQQQHSQQQPQPSQAQPQAQPQQSTAINKLLLAHQKKMKELEDRDYEEAMQEQDASEDLSQDHKKAKPKPSYGMTGNMNIKAPLHIPHFYATPRGTMVNTSTVPLFHGLLAKAGIAKARNISSPFNVQHDVHISVEDLDDLLPQIPETTKPYVSPLRSPQSATHPADTLDSSSPPTTPIYDSMQTARKHSAENLASKLERSSISEGNVGGANGPGSPNWLPHIVSVASPQDSGVHSPPAAKQRSASENSDSGWEDKRRERTSTMSLAAEQLEMTTVRVPMPLSATSNSSIPRLVDAASLRKSPAGQTAMSPAKAAAVAALEGNGRAKGTGVSPTSSGSASSGGDRSSKFIKRKSRAISSHALAMATKRYSKINGLSPLGATPEDEEETSVEPSAPVYQGDLSAISGSVVRPDAAVLDASAEAAAKAVAAAESKITRLRESGNGADDQDRLRSQDSVRDLEKSSGTVSGKSSKKRRENYGELEEYAEGESGNVYVTTRNTPVGKRPKDEYVAVKVVPKTAKARYRKLRTELKILRRIRSQHVVRFYEYFSIDDSVWIVYEFMSRGSVTDLLAGYPEIRMPMVTISFTMHEVLTALAYLHERHIIHCDVRSDNVLIDDRGQVKLADFSSAVYLDVDQSSAQKTSLGAIYWMAPELAKGAGYSPSTDVWAAGALLYEMLEGQPPYIEYPDIKVLELSNANGMPKLSAPDACDASLVDLMRLCTTINPSERQPASRLRKHESVLSPDTAQCAQLMIDFVLQVESLAGDDEDDDDDDDASDGEDGDEEM
ncbi:hypothetical protein GGI15_002264 [Coemansia interrupta]|uniref:Non-specific serine/threonine protein kinase n=1 Tax=Coemansia interrupta TaxID=1126814 RepID=A0A9W8HFY6_9FUNG|nr:hypothetical protein GGI15_002264 [Coemansia interrupta]